MKIAKVREIIPYLNINQETKLKLITDIDCLLSTFRPT